MIHNLRARARRIASRGYRRLGQWGDRVFGVELDPGPTPVRFTAPPWEPLPDPASTDARVVCNICRWTGDGFEGGQHCELSQCPGCGSNGRDRFLHWSFTQRTPLHPALRIIECSPRLGAEYRAAMATWFFYRTSDYDLRAHQGNLQLDLQAIDLPDASLDVMLCAHVLEHVPDTDKALAELRRVIAPGGHLILQVPVLQSRTAPPTQPEFHADHTPVFWRFGFDLTAQLRNHGFQAELLCTEELHHAVVAGTNPWGTGAAEFDVPGMLAGAVAADLVVVADRGQTDRLGLQPGYMYLTWDCAVPRG